MSSIMSTIRTSEISCKNECNFTKCKIHIISRLFPTRLLNNNNIGLRGFVTLLLSLPLSILVDSSTSRVDMFHVLNRADKIKDIQYC